MILGKEFSSGALYHVPSGLHRHKPEKYSQFIKLKRMVPERAITKSRKFILINQKIRASRPIVSVSVMDQLLQYKTFAF